MKRRLGWRSVSREDLASHLRQVEVLASEAVGEASLYRCRSKDGESVAISLPGEAAVIIDIQFEIPPALERRRPPGENAPLDE